MTRVSNPLDDYNLLQRIGCGNFGEAFLCTCKREDKQFVMKKINTGVGRNQISAETELRHMTTLRNIHIVAYKESFHHGGFMYIVMHYCQGGDLATFIERHNSARIPETQILQWTLQICLGLKYIHDNNVIHRDLKPENIFLTSANDINIGDFGISREFEPGEKIYSGVGTRCYVSPEIICRQSYDNRTDVWSLGCCVYEMMTLRPTIDSQSAILNLTQGICKRPAVPRDHYSGALVKLVEDMMTEDKTRRPMVVQLLQTDILKTARNRIVSEGRHKIFVMLNIGPKNTSCMLNQYWTMTELYQNVAENVGHQFENFDLNVSGRPLKDGQVTDLTTGRKITETMFVEDFCLVHNCTVTVVLRVRGGPCDSHATLWTSNTAAV